MKKLFSFLLAAVEVLALTGCQSNATAELDTEVISCCHVVDEHAPILYVSHDKEDGMWQFLCGKEHEVSEARVISLEEALELDSTLPKIQKIKQGYIAERISRETPWKIKKHP